MKRRTTVTTKATSNSLRPFHLAIPTHSVPRCREFYGKLLGCTEGRRDGDRWQDYNFFGHQLVCHFVGDKYTAPDFHNPVDDKEVPVPHFGVCITPKQFHSLAARLKKHPKHIKFIVEPYLRFKGMPGAQYTMFFKDPSGNNLEFKAMLVEENLFAKYDVAVVATKAEEKSSTKKKSK